MDPIITVPPSGTPGAAPVPEPAPAAPASGTPSVPATPSAPATLEHFATLATREVVAMMSPPAAPAAAGPGSPPAAPPAPAEPVQTSEPAAVPAAPAEEEEPEVTPEEQAAWSEGERRLYGALRKEREKRKEARTEARQAREATDTLRQELEEIKVKLTQPEPSAPKPQPDPPAAAPSPGPNVLGDCFTPEAVDARAMQAVATEGKVMRLQTLLARQGPAAVVEQLKAEGMEKIQGVAIADLSEGQLGDFLSSVYEGARMTQLQAEPRKRFLVTQATSWIEATRLVPELKDPKNPRAQRFAQIVNANPYLLQMGAHWPVLAAKYLLGDEAVTKTATAPAPVIPAPTPTPAPVPAAQPRTTPGAPRTSVSNLPKGNEYDKAAEKVRNGTATLQEIENMATAGIQAQALPQR